MGKLCVGQKKSYRIQRDVMAEFGYDLRFGMRGGYRLNDSTLVWFPNLTDSEEDIAVRGFGNVKKNDCIIEIAATEKGLNGSLRTIAMNRIAFVRKGRGEDYQTYRRGIQEGQYGLQGLCIHWPYELWRRSLCN
jgi:hypothetical protein